MSDKRLELAREAQRIMMAAGLIPQSMVRDLAQAVIDVVGEKAKLIDDHADNCSVIDLRADLQAVTAERDQLEAMLKRMTQETVQELRAYHGPI